MDNFNEGFVRSVIDRMQAVCVQTFKSAILCAHSTASGLVNLPGKQILDSFPILQDLPEILTPYKRTWRKAREEGTKFWMSLANEVKKRMDDGTAQTCFTKRLFETPDHGLNEGEFALLTGGIFGAGGKSLSSSCIGCAHFLL